MNGTAQPPETTRACTARLIFSNRVAEFYNFFCAIYGSFHEATIGEPRTLVTGLGRESRARIVGREQAVRSSGNAKESESGRSRAGERLFSLSQRRRGAEEKEEVAVRTLVCLAK
ncbi:hypothetical protein Pr1d_42150 [Bythopirellula goksoeyrii]|uniref:Uncharacterized protein n=1 Tax=Bythopirellula goksoeyrii TaxID=1400387 RepID=A0A5B9QD50_9BACT|nr:hypothetical protein Pr1d_42150 [Bythopirellula goksoeyrii]